VDYVGQLLPDLLGASELTHRTIIADGLVRALRRANCAGIA
jgi:hypothetical protein